ESEEISSQVEVIESEEISEEINVSEPLEAIAQRNIVLIAHESKKSELAEFVTQHQEFFSQSFTITWPSVSEVLHQQAGITISQQTPAPTSGGYQTIASLVGSGEILAVIFLRDLLQPQPGQANEEALLRLCTINQVLLATNVPTAEAIVHYLKHVVD
ncbi:MAG: methylglyoxal synthase, partial [Nostoc sp. DcaGUA01]|nr:methylglyoxal synthase [Nostoc sp. DcaGUA01]